MSKSNNFKWRSKKCLNDVNQPENCVEKTFCNKVETPNESSCKSAITEDETKTKCFFEAKDPDNAADNDKCVIKEICSQVSSSFETNCEKAVTLDAKTKCTFSGGTSCSTLNRDCTEIIEGASKEICESVSGKNENLCKFDEQGKKCVDNPLCDNVGTITDDQLCKSAPTTNPITKKCTVITSGEGIESCKEETKMFRN